MYTQKFTFEDLKHRTATLSDCFSFIYLINKNLDEKKSGTTDPNLALSHWVIPAGFEPTLEVSSGVGRLD